jgi:hypothetical protein
MKLFVAILIITAVFLVLQGFMSLTIARTETQKYKVLHKQKRFEIREYEPAILATVKMNRAGYRSNSSNGFRVLASYIFGQNSNQQKIAMTSPVHMNMHSDMSTMSFVMPSEYDMEDLPDPVNQPIIMEETPRRIVASLRFGGYANDQIIERKIKELQQILESKGYRHTGEFAYLGYNPPYQAVNRRNEIIVELLDYSSN